MSRPPETLTTEESEALLKDLICENANGWSAWRNLRNYTMALLMLDAGLRVGEVCRLKIDNLIMAGRPVKALDITKCVAEKKCTRLVPLTPRLIEAIEKIWTLCWQGIPGLDNAYAFYDTNCISHVGVRQVQRIIGASSVRAFNRYIHPHILRHTFATRLMRVTSTAVVQQLLGHKRLTSTQVYCHPNGDDCKKAIDALTATP